MPAQTESLIKILDGNSHGKGKANAVVPTFKYKRTANEAGSHRFRINSVQIASSIATGGQTVRCQLPSFNACVGEIYLKVRLNLMSEGQYRPYPGAQILKSSKLRHSDVAFEVNDVKEYLALIAGQLSKIAKKGD